MTNNEYPTGLCNYLSYFRDLLVLIRQFNVWPESYMVYKRGLPEMNSCISGFIQYIPTNIITDKLKKSNAPPNKKVLPVE
tara:strand:+ start:3236 stop:3475 length:240 start_codon:yes stop_codon:yes gene_type:complete